MTKKSLQLAIIDLRKQENLAAAEAHTDQNRDQPHPNASCITPARPNQDLHQRNQVAPTVDEEFKRAFLTLHKATQVQQESNAVQHETNALFRGQLVDLQRTQNAQGATIVDLHRNQNAQGATIVQHDQRIKANEAEVANVVFVFYELL